MRRLPVMIIMPALLLIAAVAHTLQATKPKAADKKPSTRDIGMTGENWHRDQARKLMTWESGTITDQDTVLTADRFEVTLDDKGYAKTGKITGHLKIENPEHELTGDLITIDFTKKVANVVGNVRMVVKPKEAKPGEEGRSARSQLKDRAVMTCDKIDYYYRQKRAEAYSSLKVTQRIRDEKTGEEYDRVITGEKGVYTEKDEKVVVTGNPVRYKDDKGNEVTTPGPVTSSVKEGEEWLETPKFKGTFKVEEEEEEGAEPAPEISTPAPPEQNPQPPSGQKPPENKT